MVNIKGWEKNMSRFTEDEVKTIITNVMTLLNEDVFLAYLFLAFRV